MSQQQFDSPDEALAHYGVKGMKWGVRKSKPTSSDISKARARVNRDLATLSNKADKVSTAKGTRAKNAALKDVHRFANEAKARDDASIASRMTAGEKYTVGALTVFTGPVGIIYGAAYKGTLVSGRNSARQTLDLYANSKLDEYIDAS